MIRNDGSVRSINNPVRDNRYLLRDHGLYRGVIREVIYTDNPKNDSGAGQSATETVYTVMIIGGDKDGQIFNNARVLRTLGGFDNYEEISLKATQGISNADITEIVAAADPSLRSIPTLGGDVVYIQFLNGDPHMPVIVGLGNHQQAPRDASTLEGPLYAHRFNGIATDIDKNGEFSWTKDNGAYVPYFPNPENPLAPFVNQFAPLPGQEEAVSVTLNNEYNLKLSFLPGLTVTADGLKDTVSVATAIGTSWSIDGPTDTFKVSTIGGSSLALSTSSGFKLATATGDSFSIGSNAISLKNTGGDALDLSNGSVSLKDLAGDALSISNGAISLKSLNGANLSFDATGFIKLGNASGDALQILQTLIQTLSTDTAAGFGAPLTNVAQYIQLLTQIQLITGG
jgi:hypothetical protein